MPIWIVLACALPSDPRPTATDSVPPIDSATSGTTHSPPSTPPASASYHWVDATGAAATDGPELVYFDAEGLMWSLSAETGEAIGQDDVTVYFSGPDCSGDNLVTGTRARVPFRPEGDETYYVRGDSQQAVPTHPPSVAVWTYGYPYPGCTAPPDDGAEYWVIKLEEAYRRPELVPPTTGLAGPLHPER